MTIKIPFTSFRFIFRYWHWVDAAELTMEGYKGLFCWPTNTYYSFGILKERAGNDYFIVLTHQGELK